MWLSVFQLGSQTHSHFLLAQLEDVLGISLEQG